MKVMIGSILILFIISSCSFRDCNCDDEKSPPQKQEYMDIAESRYNSPEYKFNETRSHVICFSQEKTKYTDRNTVLYFFIYDIENEKIIYEDAVPGGEIAWMNNTLAKITFIPGIVREDEPDDHGYIYDVKQKKVIE